MVQLNENIVNIDSAILMHPKIYDSGHVDAFNDPLIDKDSKKRYRADVLIEDHIAKIENKFKKKSQKQVRGLGKVLIDQFKSTNSKYWVTKIRLMKF